MAQPQNGYKVYECPNCKRRKYVPFTCKSRLCSSCGTKAANEWAERIHHKLLKVPHRHVVFTIPDKLWELFRIPSLQKILFEAAKTTMEDMIKFSSKAEKRVKLKIGRRRFEKREIWDLARYIGRYIRHPPIAEYRITTYDGKQVTFWYEDTKTKQKVTIAMDKFEFIKRLLSHIPEKNFKI